MPGHSQPTSCCSTLSTHTPYPASCNLQPEICALHPSTSSHILHPFSYSLYLTTCTLFCIPHPAAFILLPSCSLCPASQTLHAI